MPFIMALGSISMDNVTLHDTWLGVDHGGPNGPNANAAQNAQRQGRIRRIYAVLLTILIPDVQSTMKSLKCFQTMAYQL